MYYGQVTQRHLETLYDGTHQEDIIGTYKRYITKGHQEDIKGCSFIT